MRAPSPGKAHRAQAWWFLRWVDELKVRGGVVLGLWFFGTVDLAVDQRVSHRLEDGDLGPLGLAPHLTFKRVVVHHLLRKRHVKGYNTELPCYRLQRRAEAVT